MVAIKVMAPQLAASHIARQRFMREAQVAAALVHDHIVTIHGVAEANGLPYLVMQFVGGCSLQERLDHGEPLQLEEILRIGSQVASGLAAAHAQGLVHRDVKPANLLLEEGTERVKITDFGLARAVDDVSISTTGVVAGTPQFMAPEQAEGRVVDRRADLFSLGSVLYTLCTGSPPFRAKGAVATLKRVCEERPRPIRELNPASPDWLVAIIGKLHAKDPALRFQSAADVVKLLGQHLAHLEQPQLTPLPAPVSVPREGARVTSLATAAAVLLIGAVALAVFLAPRYQYDSRSTARPQRLPMGNRAPAARSSLDAYWRPTNLPGCLIRSMALKRPTSRLRAFPWHAEAILRNHFRAS